MADIDRPATRILDFIADTVRERGYPPTVREIGEAVGLTSSSSVHAQLANLERHRPPPQGSDEAEGHDPRRRGPRPDAVNVPLVGRIAAGAPMLAQEHVEEYLSVPAGFTRGGLIISPCG